LCSATLIALVGTALLALPSTAAAKPSFFPSALTEACPVGHIVVNVTYYCNSEFSLRGTNGYRITVSGEPTVTHRPQGIQLSAVQGDTSVEYFGHAEITPNSIRASFGRRGTISVRFRPSGKLRRVRLPKDCRKGRAPVVKARLGNFVGTIRFRGEGGYTQVVAHSAQGGVGDPLAISSEESKCGTFTGEFFGHGNETTQELKAVILSASIPQKGVTFLATTEALPLTQKDSSAGTTGAEPLACTFVALVAERAEQIGILRAVGVDGPTSDFTFDSSLTTATVTPPGPFIGTGNFRRRANGSTSWMGSLSVPMPGRGAVRLAGSNFKGALTR
jgi:hypothetical protein